MEDGKANIIVEVLTAGSHGESSTSVTSNQAPNETYQQLMKKAADLRRLNQELNRQNQTIATAAEEVLSSAGIHRRKTRSREGRSVPSEGPRAAAGGGGSERTSSLSSAAASSTRAAASSSPSLPHPPGLAQNPSVAARDTPVSAQSLRSPGEGRSVPTEQGLKIEAEDAGREEGDELEEGMGKEALVRIQRAKISVLHKQLADALEANKGMGKQIGSLEQEVRSLTDEKRKLCARVKTLEASVEKQGRFKSDGEAAREQRMKQVEGLEKDLNSTKKAMRQLESDNKNKEVRLNRALEEVERLKAALAAEKNAKRSDASHDKHEVDKLQGEVRKLQRDKSELLTAFRKQMKLIDLLKRQKLHLEAARMLSFTEEQYMNLLESGAIAAGQTA